MPDTSQRSAEFLAVAVENAELHQALALSQDQCVKLAADAGELHAEIEALKARLAQVQQERDALRLSDEGRITLLGDLPFRRALGG